MLDRDGVLNEMCVDPEHGTVDGPMHPSQVQIKPLVPECVAQLTRWGFKIAVCTNQPSAAKGKTTQENLQAVHDKIIASVEAKGGKIARSYICWHRAEDGCECRKPKPKMLKDALNDLAPIEAKHSWMVGDGITDVAAGKSAGVQTTFLGTKRCDVCNTLAQHRVDPDWHLLNLKEFVERLGLLWDLKVQL